MCAETTNTVSKSALKRSKTRKENDKPAMKPLTTKGNGLGIGLGEKGCLGNNWSFFTFQIIP